MVSYCAWNKHNNLSSRALVWHAYHHDVFVYIVDSELFERSPSAKKKKYKSPFKADFPSSVVRNGTECNSSFSITHQTLQLGPSINSQWVRDYRQEKGSAHETQDKAEDCSSLQTEWRTLMCLSLHSQTSKSIIFLNRNLLFIWYFYDVMAHCSWFCQKKISVKTHDLR